ncbi:MAG: helix-turn-helix transcriptional regulator [Boseongicola sp. SB0676_bin_33]|uniref:Helix-turn-helix transcriptional regulator n=1 Tax=Boseongicola sp. SB0664_bin_43 TaxID=2604844 RepID=A0A6B0XZQ7_9RHOB|nr:helix-turn-helix transcriptional regulator [Boseongicola sp. SB0664_bin_43]MYF90095.1 helix-turn-helix transcriptional regulator [Boseongicola sp. SB0676_bin_33]
MEDNGGKNWFAEDAATFGDRLAAARSAQAMTQKALARRLGVSLKTLDGWENDIREPRANRLQMLAGVLDVSISWLLTGEGQGVGSESEPGSVRMSELLHEMRVLRTEMQRSVARLGVLEKRLGQAAGAVHDRGS